MAQLPPKIPNMSSNLNTFVFAHQKKTPSLPTDTVVDQQTWVDDFLDFYNSGKRGSVPPNPSNPDFNYDVQVASMSEFHQMEDNQMMSMFVNVDAPPPPPSFSSLSSFSDRHKAAASTASDQNSYSNDDEDEDVQIQNTAPATVKPAQNTVADPKRVKRILANRQSAQRSRVRKLQYISELERSVTYLQTEVSALSPQVAFLEHQRSALNASNNALRQRIAVLAQDKVFKEAHQESLKQERERLSQAYQLQQNSTATNTTTR